MKKKLLAAVGMMLSLVMAATCLVGSVPVQAGGGMNFVYKKDKTYRAWVYPKASEVYNYYTMIVGNTVLTDVTEISAKSSKSSVVKVTARKTEDGYGVVELQLKKAGSAKITVNATQNGKDNKYTFKYVVSKYKNPVSQFKIGSTNLKSKFKNNIYVNYTYKKSTEKIKIKAAKNYKIKKMTYSYYDSKTQKAVNKNIKKSKKVTYVKENFGTEVVSKSAGRIQVQLYNSKTKLTTYMNVGISYK